MADHDRTEELFDAARRLPPDQRDAFLRDACGGDETLRADVASLLTELETDPDFLSQQPDAGRTGLGASLLGVESFGSYRLLRPIGEGGMGVVFLAEQERPRRAVAIKIVHPALLSKSAGQRLEREGEALGRLRHPAIAQIIEVGRAAGPHGVDLPFIAMEYIEGEDLVAHCEHRSLDRTARLALLAAVADAVHHAHERGVVHRDLKPGNVLVDAEGKPHVLDFGIARLVAEPGSAALTRTGQVLGTPAYMAPEQAGSGPEASDPKVDVYALGALAYHLLAGRAPFDLAGLRPIDVMRELGVREPTQLRLAAPGIARDVETIVHKALDRDPERRYPSAAHLAEDIRRHLRHEAISARPPSALYVLRKLARRRRVPLLATAAVVLVVAASLLVLARSRRATLAQVGQTRELLAIVRNDLEDKDPFLGKTLDPADVAKLETAERWVAERLSAFPALAAELLGTLSQIQRERGEAERGLDLARRARGVAASELGEDDPLALVALDAEGLALLDLGRYAEAEAALARERDGWGRQGKGRSEGAFFSLHNLAIAIKQQGRYAEAEKLYRECLSGRQELLGEEHPSTLATKAALARLLQDSGEDIADAVKLLREVRAFESGKFGPDSPRTLVTGSMLGGALTALGERAEARSILESASQGLERTLGPDHPDTLGAKKNLAVVCAASGEHGAARDLFGTLLPAARAHFGPRDRRTLEVLQRLAMEEMELGDPAAAAPRWEELLGTLDESLVAPPEVRASVLYHSYLCLAATGREDGARSRLAELLAWVRAKLPEGHELRRGTEEAASRAGLTNPGTNR